MESRLSSLKEELERTKQELQQLKTNPDLSFSSSSSSPKHPSTEKEEEYSDEAEHVKFIEGHKFDALKAGQTGSSVDDKVEFQKKRYVTFANPPSVARAVIPEHETVVQRQPSMKKAAEKDKKKKKLQPLIPLIGGIFSKSKRNSPEAHLHHQFSSPSPSPRVLKQTTLN